MGKLVKLLLGITLLIIIAGAVIVAGALIYFDPNQHKDFIEDKVKTATGRTLTIDGNIRLSYYPWLGIEADGITLGNAKGFGDQPFVHVDHVAVRIKTLPLLSHQYELDTFRLHGFSVNLARNAQGVSNWDDFVSGNTKSSSSSGSREKLQFAAVILGGVDIKDGQVNWQDDTRKQQVHIKNIIINTGELTYGAPINLKVGFQSVSSNPELTTDVSMQGTLNYDMHSEVYALRPLDMLATLQGPSVAGGKADVKFHAAAEANLKSDTLAINDLALELLGTHVTGQLLAEHIKSGKPKTTADLSIQGDDLAKIVKLLDNDAGQDLEKLNDRSINVSLHAEHDLQQQTARLSKLDAHVLGSVIQGNVEATGLDQEPSARGQLKANGPDLPALLRVAGQFETGKDRKLAQMGKDLSTINDKSFGLDIQFDTNMAAGNISVPGFSLKALGIKANGNLDGKGINTSTPTVNGKFVLHGEKLQPLLAALGKKDLGDILQSVDIDTVIKNEGSEISLSPLQASAKFAGKDIPESPATVSLQADTRINPDKQILELKNMVLAGPGLSVTGSVAASKIKSDKPAVQGKLNAEGKDLALLFRLAGEDALASQLANVKQRNFKISAGVNADMGAGTLQVSDLNANLLGATINGQLNAQNIQSSKPAAKGKLSASGPDLPTLLTVLGRFESGKKSILRTYGKRLADARDPQFDIATEFDIDMKNGDVRIPSLHGKSLGIVLDGQVNAQQINSSNGKIDGKLSVTGKNLSDVLDAVGQEGLGDVLKDIAINTAIQGQGGDIRLKPLDVKATFAGDQIPNSPVKMVLSADTAANLDKQTLTVSNLKVDGLGMNLSGDVNATGIIDKPAFQGNIKLADFNLREFARQTKQKLPVTADKKVLTRVGFQSGFNGTRDSINLEKFSMKLDDSNLNGDLSINNFSQPAIKFGLAVDSINLDRYLPPVDKKQAPATPETTAAAATDLPLDTLRALNLNGEFTAGRLTVSNTKLEKVKLVIHAKDGDIRLHPLNANLYGGSYDGDVTLDARAKTAKLLINSNISKVQIEPLLKDYLQEPESPLVGVADLSFENLTATGANSRQLKATLTGTGKLKVKDGVLHGVDVNKTLKQVEIMIESKRFGKVDSSGETPFDKLTATLDINKGVVSNKDMLMIAPGFKVHGRGILANLKRESINYHMKVAVDESRTSEGGHSYNLGGYDIPVDCSGKLSQPDCKPDLGELAKHFITKDLLKGVLGGKKSGTTDSTTTTTNKNQSTDKSTEQQLQDAGKVLKDIFN